MQIRHEELIADRQRCRETIDKQKADCEVLKREIDRAERMAGELGRRLEDVRQARDRPMQHDDRDRDRLDQLEVGLKNTFHNLSTETFSCLSEILSHKNSINHYIFLIRETK